VKEILIHVKEPSKFDSSNNFIRWESQMVMMWLVIPLCMGLSKANNNIVKRDLIFLKGNAWNRSLNVSYLWWFLTVKMWYILWQFLTIKIWCILWRFLTIKNTMHFVTIFNRQKMMHFVAVFYRQNMMKYK